MKVLLDTCVAPRAATLLRSLGHDVEHVGDWPEDPGDVAILAHAHADGRVLVTLDKDFGELVIVQGQPHAGVVRLVDIPSRQQGDACAEVLARFGDELQAGAIVTLDTRRVRIRPPPGRET
ncbi:DUF5615 family PIN-like protein [Sorangium sp. So ce131]|uniref:DUF5615 family PIN-like protein n=1 Tax=Sorangium sp. So ce131 TaxID=3133282 RepID=UPI003F615761